MSTRESALSTFRCATRWVYRESTTAVVEVDGRRLDHIKFFNGEWRLSSLSRRPADVSWLRRMHRVIIRIDHAWGPPT
jgi:hypothetical protein